MLKRAQTNLVFLGAQMTYNSYQLLLNFFFLPMYPPRSVIETLRFLSSVTLLIY